METVLIPLLVSIKIRGQFFKKRGGNKMLKDLGNLDVLDWIG